MGYGHDLLIRNLARMEEDLQIAKEDVEELTQKIAEIQELLRQLSITRQAS